MKGKVKNYTDDFKKIIFTNELTKPYHKACLERLLCISKIEDTFHQ